MPFCSGNTLDVKPLTNTLACGDCMKQVDPVNKNIHKSKFENSKKLSLHCSCYTLHTAQFPKIVKYLSETSDCEQMPFDQWPLTGARLS